MRAFGYRQSLPITDAAALLESELPEPDAGGRDLLVKIEAISVNPVDTKIRQRVSPEKNEFKVLGWDAAGTVVAVGDEVEHFKVGDEVWYAGALDRPGANAQWHLVDERIVSAKPRNLSFAAAAAMPLTAITAWEMLFDRFGLGTDSRGSLLVIGAGGGVGSMLLQLAKQLTGLHVIGTAGREQTRQWALELGADQVIDHSQSLPAQLLALGVDTVDYVAALTHTGEYLQDIVDIIAPQGRLAVIDDPESLDVMPFKRKSVSIHWEFMFTRSLFQTADMREQGRLLSKVAELVDLGKIKSTLSENFGPINVENLRRAHALLEAGKARGKIVLSGFDEGVV